MGSSSVALFATSVAQVFRGDAGAGMSGHAPSPIILSVCVVGCELMLIAVSLRLVSEGFGRVASSGVWPSETAQGHPLSSII
jgi:hypothetical protein